MLDLFVEFLSENARLPTRSYEGDAGFDVYVSQDTTVWPNRFVDVPCDIAVQLPEGVWGMITGRSSTMRARRLLVHTSIIDNGYRGPLFSGVWNLGADPVKVLAGDRLAQLIPISLVSVEAFRAKHLEESDRGTAGFGSSGA